MYEYETSTINATDTITVVATRPGAVIAIKLNDAAHVNGEAATWLDGDNEVEITVTYGTTSNVYTIIVTNLEASVQLASLTLGSLTLDPTFAAGVYGYETATTDATNLITAAAVAGATADITLDGDAHTSGQAATWETGENTVLITVTKDELSKVYTVTVTKS